MGAKSTSFAEQVACAGLMAGALRNNLDTLRRRGMTEEFVDSLSELLNSINQQNYEQERCKARLTEATSKLNKLQEQLHLQMKEATTLVKLDMPQAAWVAFGIKAKR